MTNPRSKRTPYPDEQVANRLERLVTFTLTGQLPGPQARVAARVLTDKVAPTANVLGLHDRTENFQKGKVLPKWRPASARLVDDKTWEDLQDVRKLIDPDVSNFKETASDYIGTYYGWHGTIMPEYDMREPMAIVDTEVYVKQALARKLALMFRNGWEVVSEREDDADYIIRRIQTFEYVMNRPWDDFMSSILRTLLTTSNCFVHKLRKEQESGVKKKAGGRVPVAGYAIIPTHTIQPYLVDGKIVKWRRLFDSGRPYLDIPVEDIIHFTLDRKPGHIFGTPRTVAVRDDIFALRRLEENIELLFINHLFPLFHVNVGTEEAPCTYGPNGESEIELVKYQIENMPKEGVFVTDERVKVDAVGAKDAALDPTPLVDHFKSRVYVGLGMSAIDMGEGKDATRATADNISQNLKDSIKADLDAFCGQVRMFMFKEWFLEANYSTSVQFATARTELVFHEIDLDNRIKWENHVVTKFNSHLITETEARREMKYKPIKGAEKKELDRSNLHFDLHVLRLEKEIIKANHENALEMATENTKNEQKLINTQMKLAEVQARTDVQAAKAETIKAGAHEQKLAAEAKHMPKIAAAKVKINQSAAKKAAASGRGPGKPRSGTAKKSTPTSKQAQNRNTPTNQHGSNTSPHKARSSQETFANELYAQLLDLRTSLVEGGIMSDENWRRHSAALIDATATRDEGSDGDSYTRQERTELARLKDMVGETSDPERLGVILSLTEAETDDDTLRDALAGEADGA